MKLPIEASVVSFRVAPARVWSVMICQTRPSASLHSPMRTELS